MWSIGHRRPLAIALCSALILLLLSSLYLLLEFWLSVSPPAVARPASLPLSLRVPGQNLACGAGCWLPEGVSDPAPLPLQNLVLLLVPVPLAPTALHLGSSLAIGCCRWAADRCMENINEKGGGGIEVVAIDHHVGIKAEMKRNFLELEHQLDK